MVCTCVCAEPCTCAASSAHCVVTKPGRATMTTANGAKFSNRHPGSPISSGDDASAPSDNANAMTAMIMTVISYAPISGVVDVHGPKG